MQKLVEYVAPASYQTWRLILVEAVLWDASTADAQDKLAADGLIQTRITLAVSRTPNGEEVAVTPDDALQLRAGHAAMSAGTEHRLNTGPSW